MSTPDSQTDPAGSATGRRSRNPAPVDDATTPAPRSEVDEVKNAIEGVKHTRTRATFVGWIIGAIILILLLIFILQNLTAQKIQLFAWEVNAPVGVSLLIAAIAGALITALIGGARTLQLSRALKKARKAS